MILNRFAEGAKVGIYVCRQLLSKNNDHSLRDMIVETYKAAKSCFKNYLKYGICGNSILIDASSVCQLKCLDCIQSSGEFGILKRGFLKFNDFKAFVDENPNFESIEISNRGEILLNPELKEIIEYAYFKNIRLTAKNGVNLNTATDDILEHLVKYKFNAMSVSIDGASNDTYKIYRRNGNFEQVISNIKKINDYKMLYKSNHPRLYWQFVLFGHTEHELPKAKKMAKELNMLFTPKYNAMPSYSPIKDKEFVKKETGMRAVSSQEHEQASDDICFLPCFQLWTSPQISVDGKLVGCCFNSWGDFGNVFQNGLGNCVRSEKYRYAKKMILNKVGTRRDVPCSECRYYKKMTTLKRFKRKDMIVALLTQIVPETLKGILFEYRSGTAMNLTLGRRSH